MLDFFDIKEKPVKNGVIEIYPAFKVKRSKDLMVKGGAFYGIWDQEKNLWSTDAYDAQRLIDAELYKYKNEHWTDSREGRCILKILGDASTKAWDEFNRYISSLPDSWHQLDSKVTFMNTEVTRDMYVSKRLKYPIEYGDTSSYDELMSTLYSPEERTKIEWAIGCIISGDSINIQKFIVLYGEAGAGKSTVLNIIQMIFDGYYSGFDAKGLTSNNDAFSTEVLKNNPLIAIQHDGDLSKIEDNTKINSIVSHEAIIINEKRKNRYEIRPNTFLFMATNQPVKITDSKSGIIRRLIDVSPTGNKVPTKRYNQLMKEVKFELGAIAQHCLDLYLSLGPNYYDCYTPIRMMYRTDIFFNFVEEYMDVISKRNWISLKDAYSLYKIYCDDTLVQHKLPMYKFREELKDYFDEFYDITRIDGIQVRSVYMGFKVQKFSKDNTPKLTPDPVESSLILDKTVSLLDEYLKDCPAQYASRNETPLNKWSDVETTLNDLNTKRVHYVKVPENMIVIDFDLKDENGEKSMQKNLEAASKWPPTYAEFSKSELGVHLHYIYTGDVSKLNYLYSEGIEVKVFKGNASLRRKLSKCNDIPIREISSGLPLKELKKTMDFEVLKNEKALRVMIANNLLKKYHPATKPSIDFIFKLLEDAYNSGMKYDVSNMYGDVLTFALNSTHNSEYCMKKVLQMHFMSADEPEAIKDDTEETDDKKPLIFYDVEVYPNLFLICWKYKGNHPVNKMFNPTPVDVSNFVNLGKIVGFNCRRYDNHICYARMIGYTNEQLFELSQKIVSGNKNNPAFFREAYNLSYTDVYDFADASHKQSLKKFEIELGIHHQEMSIPWDQPVPDNMLNKVAEYCSNDVLALETVFNHLEADWVARQILSELSGLNVNATTNMHTTKIIFGNATRDEVKAELQYTDLSEMFPGYSFENGKSTYRGEETGEGGYVYAEPGMYTNVALLDVASMHPTSIEELNMFGKFTKNFSDLKKARIYIKHKEFDKAKKLFGGKLAPYLDDEKKAKDLSMALKTAINSVYGLTSARFDHLFKDPRNIDNIVAKRGALFMIDLKHEVQARGFTVAHIKTDSIKIPNATPDIIKFVMEFGKKYGYTFEHEATYEKMCLVNNAVYIAKDKSDHHWTATGAQFAQPYVFKTLFSHEPLIFADVCETKSVKDALYLDMNESLPEGEHNYVFIGKVGLFCPVRSGVGGGELVVLRNDKYNSATGSKGYRWLEAEDVKKMSVDGGKVDSNIIDLSYYDNLVNDAIDDINVYGDPEWFMSDEPVDDEAALPWYPPCGDEKIDICGDCPKFDQETKTCSEGYNLNGYIIERSKK
jgi:energy-coupling factor transporter ATP-binding protein EcfA2